MVSGLRWSRVRIGSERCPDWVGMLTPTPEYSEWSDAGETARVPARFCGSDESRESGNGNLNGTKSTHYASNPRNPPAQISKSAFSPRDRAQLLFTRQHRWGLRQAGGRRGPHLAPARRDDRGGVDQAAV